MNKCCKIIMLAIDDRVEMEIAIRKTLYDANELNDLDIIEMKKRLGIKFCPYCGSRLYDGISEYHKISKAQADREDREAFYELFDKALNNLQLPKKGTSTMCFNSLTRGLGHLWDKEHSCSYEAFCETPINTIKTFKGLGKKQLPIVVEMKRIVEKE